MITPGVAAALTPTSVERAPRPEPAPRARGRVRVPRVLLHAAPTRTCPTATPERAIGPTRATSAPVDRSTRETPQLKTTVRSPLSSTRDSQCQRTARASTRDSTSSPARTRSSGVIRWSTRTTSCSMIGPSSRSAVT